MHIDNVLNDSVYYFNYKFIIGLFGLKKINYEGKKQHIGYISNQPI